MTSIVPPICIGCKHLDRTDPRPLLDPKCQAFPAGIPTEILLSQADHRKAFAGDRGIRFDPEDRDAAEHADSILGPHH